MSRFSGMGPSAMMAISAGYVPSGMAYGAIAASLHVPFDVTVAMSALVYSGAVQSTFLGFWTMGIDPATLLVTAFLLNLRHTFYGPHIGSIRSNMRLKDILTISPLLTDEVYALSVSDPPIKIRSVHALSIYAYINWVGSSALGSLAAIVFPVKVDLAMVIALPALFLALLVPKVTDRPTAIAVASSGAIAVAARLMGLQSYFIILPIAVGSAAGYLAMRRGWKAST